MEFRRESIIVSAIRTFCTSFAAIIGVLIGIVLIVICLATFATPDIFPPKARLEITADANGKRELLPQSAPVLLNLNIHGVIGIGDLTTEKIQNLLFDSQETLLSNHRVKGILLSLNTPGGTVDDSDGIYNALMAYKHKYQIPIYAFVDGMCASGGMYIASAADRIYATPSSIIGSVGVLLGPTFNYSGLMERYGVQSLTLTQGKDKDMLNPFRPWQPGEDACLRTITSELYQRFIWIVTTARPHLSKDKLINDYGAQVFVAKQAQEYGYIDVADTNYSIALSDLAKASHLKDEAHYQVMTIAPAHSFLSDLVQSKFSLLQGKVKHSFQIAPYIDSELSGRFLYLYQPQLDQVRGD